MYNTLLVILIVVLALAPVLLYCIQKTRMEYYSEFRRRPEEIKEWLEKRRWYERFKTNVQSYLSPEEAEDLLSGQFDLDTICSAFMWEGTPEGIEFWVSVSISSFVGTMDNG